jgi:murein L,D-transpeptidase YcbB/YkuD
VRALYTAARPLWTRDGRPTAPLRALVAELLASEARGLRPGDYDAAALARDVAALDGGRGDATLAARVDVAATVAALRHAAHLHAGRLDAHAAGFDLPETHRRVDWAAIVAGLARAADLPGALRALEPPYAGYRALVAELARQRALAAGPPPEPLAWAGTVREGDPLPIAPALRRRLAALGDLPAAAADDTTATYDAAIAAAIVLFQRRHGLEPDGVIGPATRGALQVTPAERARQIALTLERWRWLPDAAPARAIVVNAPAFRLYALDDPVAGRPALRMNVVVGEAGRHATPVFVGEVRDVVFRPYWDVPRSIANAELLPRIRRDPGYLRRERLEIASGGDHDARVHAPTAANLARVAAGTLRLRQRPGAGNALGGVKIVFPNRYNVYLHDTPSTQLFARSRRDFSHGCIRVEQPAALATWVLAGQAPWDRAAVDAAMAGGPDARRVRVVAPIAVWVLYATAVVDEDGRPRFYPDVYGHDRRLAALLDGAGE